MKRRQSTERERQREDVERRVQYAAQDVALREKFVADVAAEAGCAPAVALACARTVLSRLLGHVKDGKTGRCITCLLDAAKD